MIEIRRAGPDDADALGEIHAAAWAAAYAHFFDPRFATSEVQDRRMRWHRRIAQGTGPILLAALDGRPLALSYSVPSVARPAWAEIYSFYGHPDGWGSGVAAALLNHTLVCLRENGFAQVHLWTLRDTPQSRRFYAKSGFTESGAERVHDFGDDTLLHQVEYERSC